MKSCTFADYRIVDFWESCIETQSLSIDYDSIYDQLRGYGFGEQFIRSEGVFGDISRDVNRTFPTHVLFRNIGGLGQLMLENVLRCISEYFPKIGYCQGMNFVVGVVIIGIVDPDGAGFSDDVSTNETIMQYVMTESQSHIEKRTFSVVVSLIRLLHMEGLWSAGIPELKRFIFVLQKYMKLCCPRILTYFEDVGYDVSIIVSKWFITLFAYTLPFSLLFRLWGYIFCEKWVGVIRISIGLLKYFETAMLDRDIVELSILMKDVRTEWLQTSHEVNILFDCIISVTTVTEDSYQSYLQDYERESTGHMDLMMDYIPSVDKKVMLIRRSQISSDILSIRTKLESISEQEYDIKKEYRKYTGIFSLLEEEESEMKEYKRGMLNQVESLLYLDQNMLFDPDVKEDDMTKISFLRQQDISTICAKITDLTAKLKKKRVLMESTQDILDAVKRKWEVLLKEKNLLKDELMDVVKQQANLLK